MLYAGLRLAERLESCALLAEGVDVVRRVLRVIRDARGEQVHQSLTSLTLLESSINKGKSRSRGPRRRGMGEGIYNQLTNFLGELKNESLIKTTNESLASSVHPSGSGVHAALACLQADAVFSLFRLELVNFSSSFLVVYVDPLFLSSLILFSLLVFFFCRN